MSNHAKTVSEARERIARSDPTLRIIMLTNGSFTDADVREMTDCLLEHPNSVSDIWMGGNRLTDETGVKLARYLAASSVVMRIDLRHNLFGNETYYAMAAALRVNTTLTHFCLFGNQPTADLAHIDAAFLGAARLNPTLPTGTKWWLCSYQNYNDDDFARFSSIIDGMQRPSMLEHLAIADE